MREILLYIGSGLIFLWGALHIIKTRDVVSGFEPITLDNKRVLVMEWIAEGLTLCFLGLLVVSVTIFGGVEEHISIIVYRASALMLVAMAILSLFTGARVPVIPYKLCPPLFMTTAFLFFLGSVL